MPVCLIGAEAIRRDSGAFRKALVAGGFECLDPPGHKPLSEAEMLEWLPLADAILAGGERISAAAIAAAPRLRVIARVGVGYEAVDLPAASAAKVLLTITPGANHDSVAEHAFALILALARRIAVNDRIIRSGGWERSGIEPIRGKTLGLVGLGRIGGAMVPRASAFGMKVVGFDPAHDAERMRALAVAPLAFDELLAQADIVSLHLPLLPATLKMIGAGALALMKPTALLINTSRGGLVDEAALYEALSTGRIAGAGLDVFDPEPPRPDHPLLQLDNVVIAPHVAGIDTKALADMALMAAQGIVSLATGGWPGETIVNRELGPGWSW